MIPRLVALIITICTAQLLWAQSEFMIHGRVRLPSGQADSILLTVRSSTDSEFKKDLYLTGRGDYRIFMKYGNEYVFKFSKKNFLPLEFTVSTVLPASKPQCCQLPLELSFRMIEPGSEFDSLFAGTFMDIRYENSLKGYNYDLDIDYRVQTMLRQAQLNKQKTIQNAIRRKQIEDSMAVETQYFGYISRANAYYAAKNYTAARETFYHALEVKPDRLYPRYKLEDIRTAEEKFGDNLDTLEYKESIPKPKIRTVEIPQIPPFRYTPPSKEAIAQKVSQDIEQKIIKESASPEIAQERLRLVASSPATIDSLAAPKPVTAEEKTVAQNTAEPEKKEEQKPIDELEVNIPRVAVSDTQPRRKNEQIQSEIATLQFDEKAYQDSLKRQYPRFKTEVVEEDLYKKTTRVFINKDQKVTIFMKVEHAWGGIYYFIDRTPLVPENISQGFFDSETRSVDYLQNTD